MQFQSEGISLVNNASDKKKKKKKLVGAVCPTELWSALVAKIETAFASKGFSAA